jgi:DNA-binding MurR/RpiR family transcriptional regulator
MSKTTEMSEYLSTKVTSAMARSIEQDAARLGVSKSAIIRMRLSTGIVPTYQIHELRG